MTSDLSSRRLFLQLGTIGLGTSLAGCAYNQNPEDYNPEEDRENPDNEPDGPLSERPADSPVQFRTERRGDFEHYDLYIFLPDKDIPFNGPDIRGVIEHEDNNPFHVEILDKDTAKATLENTNVRRDTTLKLYIRDADNNWETVESTLFAFEEDNYDSREVEFDISDITLPTSTGGICALTGLDSHPNVETEMAYKIHQFVGIPYNDSINWINSDNFNYDRWRNEEGVFRWAQPTGVNGDETAQPGGYVDYIDTDDERIVFLSTCNTVNGEVFGVSCHVPHEPAQDYKEGDTQYQRLHNISYECRFATDVSHLQELAEKTDEVITDLGITDDHQRVEALGDLIQTLPYEVKDEAPPTVILYDREGDCSEKSGLFSAIIQNDPWNMMPAFISSEIDGTAHLTIGIDVDDLGADYATNDNFTVSPTDSQIDSGIPDTEFAFFDMTYDSSIGEKSRGVTGRNGDPINIYDAGHLKNVSGRTSDTPPDY